MKKMFTTAAILLSAITIGFAANGNEPVNQKVKYSFDRAFAGADNIAWKQVGGEDIYKAAFVYNNEKVEAYYGIEGELLATARYINLKQLPLSVAQSLKVQYDAFVPEQEVIEYADGGETVYYVRLAGSKAIVTVKATANGDLSVFSKEKRKK